MDVRIDGVPSDEQVIALAADERGADDFHRGRRPVARAGEELVVPRPPVEDFIVVRRARQYVVAPAAVQ